MSPEKRAKRNKAKRKEQRVRQNNEPFTRLSRNKSKMKKGYVRANTETAAGQR